MKHKWHQGKLLHGDFKGNDERFVMAEFSSELNKADQKTIVATLNHGDDMLKLYKQYRDNLHISNVQEMIEHMEGIYRMWSYQMIKIGREEINERHATS